MLITHYGLDGVRIRTVCCPHPNKYSTFQLSCKELENRKQQRPLRNSTSRSDGFQRFHPISYPQNADSPYSVFWRVLDGVRILDGLQQYPHPNKYSPFRSPCKEIEYKKQQHPLRSSTSRSDGFPRFRPIVCPQNADSPYSAFWRVLDGVRICGATPKSGLGRKC